MMLAHETLGFAQAYRPYIEVPVEDQLLRIVISNSAELPSTNGFHIEQAKQIGAGAAIIVDKFDGPFMHILTARVQQKLTVAPHLQQFQVKWFAAARATRSVVEVLRQVRFTMGEKQCQHARSLVREQRHGESLTVG